MRKPHLRLLPNKLSNQTALQADLSELGASWRRTIGLQWGPLVGTFRIEGTERELVEYMNKWLGLHLEERMGHVTWEGIVFDLTLYSRFVRRRSLENVWNAVRGSYENLLENGGFETLDPGSNTFLHWTDVPGGGSIAVETTKVISGSRALKLSQPTAPIPYVYQQVTVTPKTNYRLSAVNAHTATAGGQWVVYDVSNAQNLFEVASYSFPNTVAGTYIHVRRDFTTPAGCNTIQVQIKSNTANTDAFWDDVELVKIEESSKVGPTYTNYQFNNQSVNAYGTKELSIEGNQLGPTETARMVTNYLNRHAWPQLERLPQRGVDKPYLEGVAIGYGLTMDWQYRVFQQAGSSQTASSLANSLIGYGEYVQNIAVIANNELVRLSSSPNQRLKAAIDEVVQAAGNGDYWRVYFRPGRYVVFEPIDFTPKYFYQDGEFRSQLNGPIVNPYHIVPGVVRDVTYPHGADYFDSPYQDRRDVLLEEIVVEDGKLSWSLGDF